MRKLLLNSKKDTKTTSEANNNYWPPCQCHNDRNRAQLKNKSSPNNNDKKYIDMQAIKLLNYLTKSLKSLSSFIIAHRKSYNRNYLLTTHNKTFSKQNQLNSNKYFFSVLLSSFYFFSSITYCKANPTAGLLGRLMGSSEEVTDVLNLADNNYDAHIISNAAENPQINLQNQNQNGPDVGLEGVDVLSLPRKFSNNGDDQANSDNQPEKYLMAENPDEPIEEHVGAVHFNREGQFNSEYHKEVFLGAQENEIFADRQKYDQARKLGIGE